MRTLGANFNKDTSLVISGIKGKINEQGEVIHAETLAQVKHLADALLKLVKI